MWYHAIIEDTTHSSVVNQMLTLKRFEEPSSFKFLWQTNHDKSTKSSALFELRAWTIVYCLFHDVNICKSWWNEAQGATHSNSGRIALTSCSLCEDVRSALRSFTWKIHGHMKSSRGSHTLWRLPSFLSVLVYPSRSVSHHLLAAAGFGHPGAVSVHEYRQVREISDWQFDVQEIIGNLWSLTLLEWQRDHLCHKCTKMSKAQWGLYAMCLSPASPQCWPQEFWISQNFSENLLSS